jgi:hypothetical protein
MPVSATVPNRYAFNIHEYIRAPRRVKISNWQQPRNRGFCWNLPSVLCSVPYRNWRPTFSAGTSGKLDVCSDRDVCAKEAAIICFGAASAVSR